VRHVTRDKVLKGTFTKEVGLRESQRPREKSIAGKKGKTPTINNVLRIRKNSHRTQSILRRGNRKKEEGKTVARRIIIRLGNGN